MKKKRRNKEPISDEEFIRLNKIYNKFIVYKNTRDRMICELLIGIINSKKI